MEEIKNITEPMIKEISNKKYTKTEILLIESIRKIKNPFRMISVRDVMRDLHICENVAYKTFKRPDFPSINIGKNNQVMLLPYLIWKMEKRD